LDSKSKGKKDKHRSKEEKKKSKTCPSIDKSNLFRAVFGAMTPETPLRETLLRAMDSQASLTLHFGNSPTTARGIDEVVAQTQRWYAPGSNARSIIVNYFENADGTQSHVDMEYTCTFPDGSNFSVGYSNSVRWVGNRIVSLEIYGDYGGYFAAAAKATKSQ